MEYVHAALLLHSAGQTVNEDNISKVLEAAGAEVDEARVKALTAALEGVDIDEAIESAVMPAAQPAPAPAEAAEEKPEEEEEKEEEAEEEEEEEEEVAGLGELFG
ncbi:50S ribosomal protein L12 [candidate division MSBL1 archaeon SCGC-AAA261O19]|uniref:Large ribosomal subunit protein P1 n=1 Tax=candidate division MSBL1 archaeon SCGC-AAA261O19 TaxID=1698277 RepID=A0A133VEB7_9EURY|nr:50S ribosomal protein L12 [candidate division MSBL1 archaeon SCGC-AAA261O19]